MTQIITQSFHFDLLIKKSFQFLIFLFTTFGFATTELQAQTGGPVQVVCPGDIVKNNDPGVCGAIVTYNVSVSGSQSVQVNYSRPSGSNFPVGTTNVTVTVYTEDYSSILSTCSFNVTVINKSAPVFSGYSNITVNCPKDSCGAVVNFSNPTATKNCLYTKKTFTYTGAVQTFTVPEGVTSLDINANGARGGHPAGELGIFGFPGYGGQVEATIPVTPGEQFSIWVGGKGQDATSTTAGTGGFNGGANGAGYVENLEYGGGGGGATDIRLHTGTLTDRLIVAGGGGAAGFFGAGGNGGDLVGGDAFGNGDFAKGGTQTAGGFGGSFYDTYYGDSGTFGFGGKAAIGTTGGGGGGGWYGGGGGAFGDGAGGSSYTVSTATNVFHAQGANEGDGYVTIMWNKPPTVIQTAGLPSGSVYPTGTTTNTFTATDEDGNISSVSFTVIVKDEQKPLVTAPAKQTFNTVSADYIIPALTATDNCGIGSVSYSITGTTNRTGTGTDASGNFNAGTSTINWTVTDIHGNVEVASTIVNILSPSTPPSSNLNIAVADVWAVAPWGVANRLYIGFGPTSLKLEATVTNGIAPYTYTWTKAGTAAILSTSSGLIVTAAGDYVVTVKDATGAIGTITKKISVEDVTCGNQGDKVSICHMSNGNNDKATTICVNKNSVEQFLKNGNYLGNCVSGRIINGVVSADKETVVKLYPNPTKGKFQVKLNNTKTLRAEIIISSVSGLIISKQAIQLTSIHQLLNLNVATKTAGMYLVKVITEEGIQTLKVVVQP